MQRIFLLICTIAILLIIGCKSENSYSSRVKVRSMADTIGFAQYDWQMDSIISRINNNQKNLMSKSNFVKGNDSIPGWKAVICPHDDYAYAGHVYHEILQNVKAKTIIIFGVAHKAKQLRLENQIIFDSYPFWHGPYGDIKVSSIREEIMAQLPKDMFQVNDSMQTIEHSVEALLPFLQYYNRDVEVVSILVPYMPYEKMDEISKPLAEAIKTTVAKRNWQWGKDYAIAISSDAVHYGDKGWGGKNFARYGTNKQGYKKAVDHEKEIISNCLMGEISPEMINLFTEYTVEAKDYKQYKWTWCGRYSVPLGMLTSYQMDLMLQQKLYSAHYTYANSIDHTKIKVDDLKMGTTAPANINHWVGYAAIGYK